MPKTQGPLTGQTQIFLDVFTSVVLFIKNNQRDVIITIILAVMGIFIYFSMQYLQIQLDTISDAQMRIIQGEPEPNVKETLSRQLNVNNTLKTFALDIGADRARIFQFNNGTESTTGIPYLFTSVTHEGVRDGISAEGHRSQNYPSFIFAQPAMFVTNGNHEDPPTGIDDYKSGYIRCLEVDDIKDSLTKELLRSQKVKHTCSYGILKNGEVFAILTIHWVTTPFTGLDEEKEFKIKSMSKELSNILWQQTTDPDES